MIPGWSTYGPLVYTEYHYYPCGHREFADQNDDGTFPEPPMDCLVCGAPIRKGL